MSRSTRPLAAMALAAVGVHAVADLVGAVAVLGPLRLLGGIAAAAVALVTARRRSERRGAWWLIGGGLAAASVGDLAWAAHELLAGAPPPAPWPGDLLYLGGWAAIVTGISFLVADPVPARRMSARLDIGVLCLAAAVGLWFLVAEDLVLGGTADTFTVAVAVAYLVVDLALLSIIATLLLDPQPTTPTIRLLTAGVAAQLVGDLLHVVALPTGPYVVGDTPGSAWFLALVLLSAAIVHPSSSVTSIVGGPPEDLTRRRLVLLWAAVGATALTSVIASLPNDTRSGSTLAIGVAVGGGATVLMATLVLWRLALTADSLRDTLVERERLQSRLEHEANHDALTGLANRRCFTDATRARGGDGVVLFIDLDRFKEVNDRLGHGAGDEVLRTVASRLVGSLRSDDLVARLGGDEFATLLAATPPAEVGEVAARLLTAIREPIVLASGSEVRIDASVGTATERHDDAGPVDLLRDADAAMYEAKRAGRSRVVAYTESVHEELSRRTALQGDLEHAVARGELHVVYQPLVAIPDGRPVGVEALVRWDHPTRGSVPPGVFIPLAESSGHILDIGRFVLEEACRSVRALPPELGPLGLSVNVSPVQLHQGGFAADVEQVLDAHGFDPCALTLEITETVLLEDAPVVRSVVERLRTIGVRFAVDDFGTGYSALRYLRDVPLDELKIDRSFVRGMGDGPAAAAFALAMVDLAARFGLRTVAEGIETEHQLAALAAEGCDLGQGYLFAPPLASEDLIAWLRVRRTAPLGDLRPA